jgi:hypothetical protein
MFLPNKVFTFIPLLLLASSPLVAQPQENPPPVVVDTFVVNDEANPVPVVVQDGSVEILDQRIPFQERKSTSFGGDDVGWRANLSSVSAGQRLTVEMVNISYPVYDFSGSVGPCRLYVVTEPIPLAGAINPDTIKFIISFPVSLHVFMDTLFPGNQMVGLSMLKIFLEAGDNLACTCDLPDSLNLISSGNLAATGYLAPE